MEYYEKSLSMSGGQSGCTDIEIDDLGSHDEFMMRNSPKFVKRYSLDLDEKVAFCDEKDSMMKTDQFSFQHVLSRSDFRASRRVIAEQHTSEEKATSVPTVSARSSRMPKRFPDEVAPVPTENFLASEDELTDQETIKLEKIFPETDSEFSVENKQKKIIRKISDPQINEETKSPASILYHRNHSKYVLKLDEELSINEPEVPKEERDHSEGPVVRMEQIFAENSEFSEENQKKKIKPEEVVEERVPEKVDKKLLATKSSFRLSRNPHNTAFSLPQPKIGPYKTESKLLTGSSSLAEKVAAEIALLYYDATQCNNKIALEQLKEYVSVGYHSAEGFMMRIYALGQCGLPEDRAKAKNIGKRLFPWFKTMAESAEPLRATYARYHIAVCYSEGLGVPQDHETAAHWYKQSAERGYTGAQAYLGYCYFIGIGVQQNHPEAVKWYRMAADQGYCAAQFNLGVCYEQGDGVEKNIELAIKYYRMAAEQGSSSAQYNLGSLYERGEGVMQNYHKAVQCYSEAANQGYAKAEYALGCFYLIGQGVDKDQSRGIELITRASEKGYALAQVKLGLCYEEGSGIKRSRVNAMKLYYQAAEQGNSNALYRLGIFHLNGTVVEKDLKKAAYFFQLATERDHRQAQVNLGMCYLHGQGVDKNLILALKLLKTSSTAEGHFQVGRCYEKGIGVAVDVKEAIRYYLLANNRGNADAHAALLRLRITI